jgi:beta-glucosidase
VSRRLWTESDREVLRRFDGEFNRWWLDPLYGRGYPADIVEDHRRAGHWSDFVRPGDLEAIAAPTDFLGVNYYSRAVLRSGAVPEEANLPRTIPEPPESSKTDMGWEVHPRGLRLLLGRIHRDYAPRSLVVTENGAAYAHGPDAQGVVDDEPRRAYLEGHLRSCLDALADGVPLDGYFAWSLMDNFEWAYGYEKRFGLVHVDYATQARTVKASGRWFADVARAGRLPGMAP